MISVQHLTKRFGKFTAVDGVSLEIKEGEIFAFLGPNGSGKTTTMKSLVGLVKPTSCKILVNGIDVQMHPKEAKTAVSYLPQRVVFPENLTAREIVRFFARLRGVPQTKADEVLESASHPEGRGWR
ncbi:MAG: ABC-type multidrug transport system, ATPase component [Bacteroidetes bacterium]|nr:ABC-type multidrug transport system, ATPase component [Bacteroidota bacterium]